MNDQLFVPTFELRIPTTTTCKTVEVFGHEGTLLATGTGLLCPSDVSRLVNFVHIMRLWHLGLTLFLFF